LTRREKVRSDLIYLPFRIVSPRCRVADLSCSGGPEVQTGRINQKKFGLPEWLYSTDMRTLDTISFRVLMIGTRRGGTPVSSVTTVLPPEVRV
jgi:hypothetical protein